MFVLLQAAALTTHGGERGDAGMWEGRNVGLQGLGGRPLWAELVEEWVAGFTSLLETNRNFQYVTGVLGVTMKMKGDY